MSVIHQYLHPVGVFEINKVTMTPTDTFLHLVCPSLGTIIASVMFAAPISSLREAISRGTLGDLNPTPWAFMTGNCLGWVSYAVATQDLFVLFSNAPGLILSIWLNMGAAKLQYQQMHELKILQGPGSNSLHLHEGNNADNHHDDYNVHGSDAMGVLGAVEVEQDVDSSMNGSDTVASMMHSSLVASLPSFTPHEIWVLRVIFVWLFTLCAVCFIPMSSVQQANIIGSLVNMNLVIFYGAPLSTIVQVVRTRNSSSIHRRTMVMGLLNSFFWLCYGIALMDMIIFFPNACGFLLGMVQLILCALFPKKSCLVDPDAAVQEQLVGNHMESSGPDVGGSNNIQSYAGSSSSVGRII